MAGSISAFTNWMRTACDIWSLGYSWDNRWAIYDGGECDCSSLVIWCLNKAGFDTGNASYTGDLSDNLTARGWKRIKFTDLSQVRTGDILLNDERHVCAVISGSGASAIIAQASINENGQVRGGKPGDQTGGETNTKRVYVYPRYGWDCILRYSGADVPSPVEEGLTVDGAIGPLTISEWQRQCKTTVDGVVSGQMKYCQAFFPALTAVTFEGTGSALMKKVQEIVGVPNPTGVIASGTVCMLQGFLVLHGYSCAADSAGVLGQATAESLQKSLNDKVWESASA